MLLVILTLKSIKYKIFIYKINEIINNLINNVYILNEIKFISNLTIYELKEK